MTKSKIGIAWMVVLPLLGGAWGVPGCAGNAGTAESTGTVGMQVTLPDGSHIGTVSYTISGGPTAKSGTFDVSKSNTVTAIIGGLAAGSGYIVSLSSISSAGYPCVGTAGPFTVKANATLPIAVVLTCHAPRRNGSILINGVVDVCPGIDSIDAAPAAVTVGNDVTVSVFASPDQTAVGFPLAYAWTGVTSSQGATATFHCFSAGSFPITVSVSNSDSACNTMPPDPAMSATVTIACEGAASAEAGASPDSGGSGGDAAADAPVNDASVTVTSTGSCSVTPSFPIPNCTNLAANKPASASGSYPGYPIAGANDGNCKTGWNSGDYSGWWQVDLGSVQPIRGVTISPGASPSPASITYTIAGSADGALFTTRYGGTGTYTSLGNYAFDFGGNGSARYLRITASSPVTWIQLQEVGVLTCP
jgi:hypothetical protein